MLNVRWMRLGGLARHRVPFLPPPPRRSDAASAPALLDLNTLVATVPAELGGDTADCPLVTLELVERSLFVEGVQRELLDQIAGFVGGVARRAGAVTISTALRDDQAGTHAVVSVRPRDDDADRDGKHQEDFALELPLVPHSVVGPDAVAHTREWKGEGTVLLADDNREAQRAISRMLAAMGFTVMTANDGDEAVQCFRDYGRHVCLLVLDEVMPKLRGVEVVKTIRNELSGEVPAVIVSGLADTEAVRQAGAAFLGKPFGIEELEAVVREAFGEVA